MKNNPSITSTRQSSVTFQHSKVSNFFSLSQKFEKEKLFSAHSVKNQTMKAKNFKFELSIGPEECLFFNNKSLKSFSSLLSVRPKTTTEGERKNLFITEEKSENNYFVITIIKYINMHNLF